MHPYQIEDEVKTRVFIVAIVFSIVAARLLSLLLINLPFAIPWWVETPSVLGFFGFFILAFNKVLWKTKIFQKIEWFYIPNLNGEWKTEIRSSHKGFEEPLFSKISIQQTASHISITMDTEESISYSVSAILLKSKKLNQFELTYNYVNQPKADSISTMNIHMGTVWVQVSNDCKHLDGEYYSGRGRQNFGRIIMNRG